MPDDPRPDDTGTPSEAPASQETSTATAEPEKPKLEQTVEMRDIGPCKKHIRVSIARASIDERIDAKFGELMPESNVAGFRPGKAPKQLVRRRYQKEVSDQVRTELLLESLEQLAEEHDVAPLTAPDLDPRKIELPASGPLVYEFDVEVRPEINLPNYKGLKLRRPVQEFTDADVAEEERRLLASYGQIVPKPEGNVQVGDVIVADVTSRDGDRQLGTIPETQVRVERRLLFKDGVAERFAEQVRGANIGDQRVVDIKLSEGVADGNLKGKTVKATFQIKDVKTIRMPEMTPEFLQSLGARSVEHLHELLRVLLNRRLEYQQRQSARQQVMEQLAVNSNWELPEELLRRQARKALQRRVMEMQSQGISEDEIRQRLRILQQDALASTAAALKEHFVLQKIAEVEKIDINDDDIEEEIDRIAEQNQESPRRVRARLERDDLIEALAAEMIERRALDLLLESAEYEDVPLAQADEAGVSTVEEQTVPGEMTDPTAPPPPEEPKAETPPAQS